METEIQAKFNEIEEVAGRVGRASNAQAVVLFGSHARGDWGKYSDVDILVIAKTDLPYFRRTRSLCSILRDFSFPVDLLVYTPQEYMKLKADKTSIAYRASKDGKILYGNL
jgi:uncharacterized protein